VEQRGAGQRQRWVRVDMAEACRAQGSGEALTGRHASRVRIRRASERSFATQSKIHLSLGGRPTGGRARSATYTAPIRPGCSSSSRSLTRAAGNFFQNNRNITPFNKVSLEEDSTAHAQHTLVHVHVHVAALSWDVQGPEGYIQD